MIQNISSNLTDSSAAISDVLEQVNSEVKLLVLFISPIHNLALIEKKLADTKFKNKVIACTTSGEISSHKGLSDDSLNAMCFSGDDFESEIIHFTDIAHLEYSSEALKKFSSVNEKISNNEKKLGPNAKSVGILLIDGMSMQEESLSSYLGGCLPEIQIVGGSAGDSLKFEETFVFTGEKFTTFSASVAVLSTNRNFEVFKHQHFKPTEQSLIVTSTDSKKRIVHEINGSPAAEYYADLLNLKVDELSPNVFSSHPLMLQIGDSYYVRSIQQVNPDMSLTFYCAIENGLVLRLAQREDLLETNQNLFNFLEQKIESIDSCLLLECILRKLEISSFDENKIQKINDQYNKYNCTGFYTYGEQYASVHINQTLTGIAFGKK